MQRIVIKLNEEKIDELGIDREELKDTLEDAFKHDEYVKTVLEDGTMQFDLKPGIRNYVGAYGCVNAVLAEDEDFMAVCDVWDWYNDHGRNNDEEYEIANILETERYYANL